MGRTMERQSSPVLLVGVQPQGRRMWLFLVKLSVCLPGNSTLRNLPQRRTRTNRKYMYKVICCGNICNSKRWEYQSIGDWLTKLWFIHNIEYFAAIKNTHTHTRKSFMD